MMTHQAVVVGLWITGREQFAGSSFVMREGRPMYETPEDALARIEDDVRRAEERAARLPELQAAMESVRGRAISIRRDIAVEVDSGGQLHALDISDAALELGGRRVSQEVLMLVRKATQDVRAQTLALSVEILGEDDPIVKLAAADLETDTAEHPPSRLGRRA